VRELAVIVLERQGYRVLEAADGDEAIDVWERGGLRIDLLLSDMVMPGSYTGRALAEKLHCGKPSLKVIICSGYSADAGRNMHEIGENFVFLQKPYNPRKLCETVRQCLDAKEPAT
jgi:two-component system cell cycle sensor histidine kinase/response regulator CckA